MKRFIKDYLSFSKKERNAAIVLLMVIASFVILPYFFGSKKKTIVIDKETEDRIAALKSKSRPGYDSSNQEAGQQAYVPQMPDPAVKYEVFEFDPNTLDAAGWRRLGIRDKTVAVILNYRSKGGKFKQPEDLRKVWGLASADADRIIPYALVEKATATPLYNNNKPVLQSTAPTAPVIQPVDLNTATADQLKIIPGMVYPAQYKIINFRDKLGGFLSVDQVKETYGLSDSVFNAIQSYLVIKTPDVKRININTADNYQLSSHPYIGKEIGRAIVVYRQQHGDYQSVNDLKKIVFIKDNVIQKMAPYLTVN